MMPRDSVPVTPSRRRPSLSIGGRPRTAASPQTDSKLSVWNGLSSEEVCEDDHDQVIEETVHFPDPAPRRRSSKSFSSFRHPVDGLRTLGRRLSVTLRARSSRQPLESLQDVSPIEAIGRTDDVASGDVDTRLKSNWLDGHFVNRRPSVNSPSALQGFYAPTSPVSVPIPGNGLEPPILPDDMCAGAAARAAAAAQNELARAERVTSHSSESKLTRDTESGIGIDLRDRSEISDAEFGDVRIGKGADIHGFVQLNCS